MPSPEVGRKFGLRFAVAGDDLLAGFGALGVTMLSAFATRQNQDLRPLLVVAFAAFAVAMYLRASPKLLLRTATLVLAGGLFPAAIMHALRFALTDWTVWVVCGVAVLGVFAGAVVRRLRLLGRPGLAWAAGAATTLLTLFLALKAVPVWVAHRAYQAVDLPVVPFTVETLAGERLGTEQWKEHVVLLAFWATWCMPCGAELPQIAQVRARYRGNHDVVFLAIDPGWQGDTATKAKTYLDRHGLDLPGAMDTAVAGAHDAGEAARSLDLHALPTLYLLDRAGRLRAVHTGYDASEDLSETLPREIDRLL